MKQYKTIVKLNNIDVITTNLTEKSRNKIANRYATIGDVKWFGAVLSIKVEKEIYAKTRSRLLDDINQALIDDNRDSINQAREDAAFSEHCKTTAGIICGVGIVLGAVAIFNKLTK